MTTFLLIALFFAAAAAAVSAVKIAESERHAKILDPFHKVRRDLLDIVLAPAGAVSPEENKAARFLLRMANGVIRHYHPHKSSMFNLRAVRRAIRHDLRRYREMQERVREQLSDLPDNPAIHKAFGDFVSATAAAYLANTPFIRTEIFLRLLGGGLAEQIKNARHESEQVVHALEGGKLA